ncbi:MAG: metal transporter [Flavobacterium sp. BFFFF2]|nr:MAG: metal transporter [Flavobacterium sp. BFFFF2]
MKTIHPQFTQPLLWAIMIFLMPIIGFSQTAPAPSLSTNANYSFEVKGNCEMCKKRIEKAAYQVKGVKMAVWNIDTHQLDVIINETKTTLQQVKEAIAKVGHDSDTAKSTQEVYDHLHGCCQYERSAP